jgi:hypothetical protein
MSFCDYYSFCKPNLDYFAEFSEQVSVPTIDTLGCARLHPFGNGKPQKRADPLPTGSAGSRGDARRHPFPNP